jgi:hypothetical protein
MNGYDDKTPMLEMPKSYTRSKKGLRLSAARVLEVAPLETPQSSVRPTA